MSETTYYPYLGSGKIYARVAGIAAAMLEIGNASKLDLAAKEDKQTQKDFTKPGGGTHASVSRIDTVTLQMTLHDLNKTNVARAVFGLATEVAGATVAGEVVVAYKGGLSPLAHISPTAVTVKDSTDTTTYVANTDYEVREAGIFILEAGGIADADSLKVSYTHVAYDKIEAMTTGAITLELLFEGLNEANSGQPVIVDVYRVQLSPTKALSLLGDKFGELVVDAEVMKDASKTGVGISQYFRQRMAKAAG